ncbi:MAG: tyrosine--tRNA ligase [Bacillota bacterium]|nr:MAG: tyrosine--tRNA ligase [Bacillota bacterium]
MAKAAKATKSRKPAKECEDRAAARETSSFRAEASLEEEFSELARGTVQILTESDLRAKLARARREGRPLRIKFGADPSAPDIHLGHTVCLRKLRQFQEFGHEVFFVIGDFTGRIGDPSGRSETRPQLDEEAVRKNALTYERQIFKVLDPTRTRVVFNNDWLGELTFAEVIELASKYTVARMLERDDFTERWKEGRPIALHEFLYTLAQAYDSVSLRADLELGGNDQTFNFVATRDIMGRYGLEPQVVMTMPLLEGTDGVEKMSKSLGNYIGINEPAKDIYGKAMSVPDDLMLRYFELVTDLPLGEVRAIGRDIKTGALHPRDAKMRLAHTLTRMYHGEAEADKVQDEFVAVFRRGEMPEDILPVTVPRSDLSPQGTMWIARLLVTLGLASSTSEGRRLVVQGGVRVNDSRVTDPASDVPVADEMVVRVGKRRIARVRVRD